MSSEQSPTENQVRANTEQVRDVAIRVTGVSKHYQIYDNPSDRLKQFIRPRIDRLLGRAPRQYFKEFKALDNINFEVKRGETVGIIGKNGSGKSTLLQIICGTLTPTAGEVQVNGRVAALLELGSGFNPEFTGRENVYLNASVLGLTKEEIDERYDAIAAFADIGDFINQPVKTYSSGMYVRLAFAVIAHVDADILVVDEALAVGDAFFVQKCMRFLRTFMETGTVLFVSHDTGSVKSLCSKAIWLDKGNINSISTAKIISESYLEALYSATNHADTHEIGASNFRNSIKSNRLDYVQDPILASKASFGVGGAKILHASISNINNQEVKIIDGSEHLRLKITILAEQRIASPIVGFAVKDKLGQILFGENTFEKYKTTSLQCDANNIINTIFEFNSPLLPQGEYTVSVAIADGTQNSHIQLQWIHDAIVFSSAYRGLSTGLVGIPMNSIYCQIN